MKFQLVKKRLVFMLVLPMFFALKSYGLTQHFDKAAYYTALASPNLKSINEQLAIINVATFSNKDAFEGALLMKKASLVSNLREKLNSFKTGRKKLESQIALEKENIEFRFLRLMIQEHAPKILNYQSDLENDRQLIIKQFKDLPAALQEEIANYSKSSKRLHSTDFN